MSDGWVTKDGKKIPWKKVGDDHLHNIIALLKAHGMDLDDDVTGMFGSPFQGEMANYYFDQEIDREVATRIYMRTQYQNAIKERKRRRAKR